MTKRWFCFILALVLACGCASSALADAALLDRALSRWLESGSTTQFSARMELTAWQPFPEETLTMLNNVLKHATLSARIEKDGTDSVTDVQLNLGEAPLFDLTERQGGQNATLTTSLLPNRVLTSTGSPMDAWLADEPDAAAESEPDAAEAFSLLRLIDETGVRYPALMEAITPYATEKKASYKIKGIGTARWSKIARLTTEQSDSLLPQLRAVLAGGMDAAYAAELEDVHFAKGFIVALYQSEAGKDLAVYLKGTLVYPDGTTRKLAYQWAFLNDGTERTDSFTFSSTGGKPADKRVVKASATQALFTNRFAYDGNEQTTLRRNGIISDCTLTYDLSGEGDATAFPCTGTVTQSVKRTQGEDERTVATTLGLDLLLQNSQLTGTAEYESKLDKNVQTALRLTFLDEPADMQNAETLYGVSDPDSEPIVQILSPEGEAIVQILSPEGEAIESSISQLDDAPAADPSAVSTSAPDYLVGSAPIDMQGYATPDSEQQLELDTLSADKRAALLAEASQNLAAKLIVAVSQLPQEDAALLKDGMSDTDYAAFLALLTDR